MTASLPVAPAPASEPRHLVRFGKPERVLHGALMASFLGLALTGVPLRFSSAEWAPWVAHLFGSFKVAAVLHRVFAVVMIATFAAHLARVLYRLVARRDLSILWGPRSMVPQPRDLRELVHHMRWFVGLGDKPRFDHFTYWEKFDYWAVFWGMAVIGGSGLVLWFPTFFGAWLPGQVFNVAMVIHGEEALLAVGFIFTIHFFNGHLRPGKFPMDPVIFTGVVTEEELREERPAEWERLQAAGGVDGLRASAPAPEVLRRGRVVGATAVLFGLTMVALILYAALWSVR